MTTGGDRTHRQGPRFGIQPEAAWRRAWRVLDRSGVIAVLMAGVMLLSIFAMPVAGAAFESPASEPVASNDVISGGPDVNAKTSPNALSRHSLSKLGTADGRPVAEKNEGKGKGNGTEKQKGRDKGNSDASSPPRSAAGGPDENRGPPAGANNGNGHGPAGAHGPQDAGAGNSPGGPTIDVGVDRSSERDNHRSERGNAAKDAAGGAPDDPPPTSDGPTPTRVDVSVKNVESGNHVDIDVSPPSVEDEAVAFDGISATVNRDGDFTMRVTNSRAPLPDSPKFEPDGAAIALGHVRLDHSVANEAVEDVSYTFRVEKAYLQATGNHQEQVALYRYEDGGWTELPTDVVAETPTHYVLAAVSPGMSEFVVGAKRPSFDVYWANVDDTAVDAGTTVTVSGRVMNTGDADGVHEATLSVDGEVVENRAVTIAAGGTRQVNFEVTFDRPGTRELAINGVSAGEVTVRTEPADPEAANDHRGLVPSLARLFEIGGVLGNDPSPSRSYST